MAQHKGKPIQPNSIESKILFDADRLEKSGIGGTYASYRAQIESELPVIEWAKKIAERGYKNEDFFSEKAKEISDNGLKEKENHFQEVIKSLEKRRDWSIEEKDLWE